MSTSSDQPTKDKAPEASGGSGGSGDSGPSSSSASGPPAPEENPWEVNKPVERRSQMLNEESHDCLYCFWSWITCGGPAARVRQLYINGKLSRCMDDWTRLKNCMIFKLDPEQDMNIIPGPHPVWRIRTRKQAGEFWQEQFKHLREGVPRGPASVRGGADPDQGTLATSLEHVAACQQQQQQQ